MAACTGKPVDILLVFVLLLHILCKKTNGFVEDSFAEELYIKSLEKGHVLNHFHFTTLWNSSISDENTFNHYRLFPKALGDVLTTYKVQELHLSQTQGLWNYEHWGYPPEDAPPGVELWVWFQPHSVLNIDQVWAELVNALSGLFCSSLNFMDSKATVIPRWSFRPMGIASEYYSFDSRFMRYSALPREIVCTENLTPWEKLLPCESQVGLASLFNAGKLYDSSYHSLGLHVRPVCQSTDCNEEGIELRQTLTIVFNPTLSNKHAAAKFQNWSLKSMFDRVLHDTCPMAEKSKVYVDMTLHPPSTMALFPDPDETVNFKRFDEKRMYAVYDLKKQIQGKDFNLRANYASKVTYNDTTPPPVYAQRFVTGFGLEKGGITCILYNNLDTNLTVIYMETIPWYLRVYFSSVQIETYGIPVKPYKTHFIPGKDRSRPHQLEVVFRLRPESVTKISLQFDRAFLKWTEYPPDANHGFYINSAVISTVIPSGQQYTAVPQHGSFISDTLTDTTTKFFLRLHTETLMVSLPTPDFSMPYNVICLACTVVAIAFGSLHNLTTRSFVAKDPEKVKQNPLQKLKALFIKQKRTEETEKTENKEEEMKKGVKNSEDDKAGGDKNVSDSVRKRKKAADGKDSDKKS